MKISSKIRNAKKPLRIEAPLGFYLGLSLKRIIKHTVWGLWRHAKTLEFTRWGFIGFVAAV